MSQNDFVIANQTAPAFRADLNSALQALASVSSGATEPATKYANMLWYDTGTNTLKKRNEANSAWITLGTVDEGAGTFTPSGERALATQAQAEAGTDNTTLMTPLRVEQHMTANAIGWGQTWTQVSRSGGTSYQNTTGRPIMVTIRCTSSSNFRIEVSTDNVTWVATTGHSQVSVTGVTFIVPNGHYYRTQGMGSVANWSELA